MVTIGLLAATSVLLHVARPPAFIDNTGIHAELPLEAGVYRGREIAFCQNEQCLRSFVREPGDSSDCAVCGAQTDALSLPERRILPADTVIRRRLYRSPGGSEMLVTVLLGSRDRTGIHRPEMCLEAQGMPIEGRCVIQVPRPDGKPLDVMMLDIGMPHRTGEKRQAWFCYWYIGSGRETASNLQRIWWTTLDNVLHGEMHRWAYLSISVSGPRNRADATQTVSEFIASLYPLLAEQPPAQ
jgi:hypothetical protein